MPAHSGPAHGGDGPGDLALLLTRAERLMTRRLADILEPLGQSVPAWRVLALLADGSGHRMTELADRAFLPPATLTKLVDTLVADNLVYRRIDPADRRGVLVYRTERGRVLHRQVDERLGESGSGTGAAGRPRDDDLLRELLTRLTDALAAPAPAQGLLPTQ